MSWGRFTLFQYNTITSESELWTDQNNMKMYHVKQTVENGWRYRPFRKTGFKNYYLIVRGNQYKF